MPHVQCLQNLLHKFCKIGSVENPSLFNKFWVFFVSATLICSTFNIRQYGMYEMFSDNIDMCGEN